MIYVVDTSVVVASLRPTESAYAAARAWIRATSGLVSPVILLAEVAAALTRGAGLVASRPLYL